MDKKNNEYSFLHLQPVPLAPLEKAPLVSVLMTNYNYAAYIEEAMTSVMRQNYPFFELIICDDGSTDKSVDLIKMYQKRDKRIKLVQKANGGQISAIIAAYNQAQGDIICLMDSDDYFYREKLDKVVRAFKAHPEAGCCLHRMLPVTKTGHPISKPIPAVLDDGWMAPHLLKSGLFGCFISTSGISFRRSVTEFLFPLPPVFTTRYPKGAPIDSYLLGLARLLSPVVAIPDTLVGYRFHDTNDGSTSMPTIKSISQVLDHFRIVFTLLYDYLATQYDQKLVSLVHLEDFPTYWEYLLALYILQGQPSEGVDGMKANTILEKLPDTRRKKIWQMLLKLPPVVAAQFFQWWWGMTPWKKYLRPVWRLLRA